MAVWRRGDLTVNRACFTSALRGLTAESRLLHVGTVRVRDQLPHTAAVFIDQHDVVEAVLGSESGARSAGERDLLPIGRPRERFWAEGGEAGDMARGRYRRERPLRRSSSGRRSLPRGNGGWSRVPEMRPVLQHRELCRHGSRRGARSKPAAIARQAPRG